MIVLLIALVVRLAPSILLFLFLLRLRGDEAYRRACAKALGYGALAVVPVVLVSAALHIVRRVALGAFSPLVQDVFHTFVVLAFAEELVKFLMGTRAMQRELTQVSRLDLIALMVIVGIGFGLAEDFPYVTSADAPMMVVRGVTVSHGVYGMLMGWCLARTWREGRGNAVLAIGLPTILHGLYDLGLTDSLIAISDDWMLLSVGITVLELILLVAFVLFVRGARTDERYTTPLA